MIETARPARSKVKETTKYCLDKLGIPVYLLQQIASEARAAWIRIWAHLPIQRNRVSRFLRRDVVRFNFGCGETRFDGWLGIDQFFAPQVDIVLDLRRRLPIPPESVNYCHSEHFLEHLYPEEGQFHLNEVYRILKPGGRYRIVVPDVLKFADRYLKNDVAFFRRAFPWAQRPMEALYCVANFRGDHRNILDHKELTHMARITGFTPIISDSANDSVVSDMNIDKDDMQRVEESLYIELVKSG